MSDVLMAGTEILTAGELEIRPGEHLARARGRALSLSVRQLDLLAALARRPRGARAPPSRRSRAALVALARREGRIVPREELYRTV
jgi:hypothetical protein